MKSMKLIAIIAAIVITALAVSFYLNRPKLASQSPDNQQVVDQSQPQSNNRLNPYLERLSAEANQAADLSAGDDEFGLTRSYTDPIGRMVEFLVDPSGTVKYIRLDGSSNVPAEKTGWKTFSSPELGFSFEYPAKYTSLSFAMNLGTTGIIANGFLSATECPNGGCARTGIEFGATTKGYTAPRGAGGVEGLGFVKKDGKYFSVWLDNYEYEITDQVREIFARNTTGIMIQGNEDQIPGPGVLPANYRKIIFNLSSEFPAITFLANIDDISESELVQILQTVEIK